MRVLDLFSGIGGFSLGLERAGMRTVAFCEIDPYCRAVLARHWPGVPCYDDVTTLTVERLAADGIIAPLENADGIGRDDPETSNGCGRLSAGPERQTLLDVDARAIGGSGIDVICGGFPCQDISTAGKGAGITGSRSGLWKEYARIIGEVRPRYAIIENVSALLHRGLADVLFDLSALGYDAEWHCIPASAVGAPHRRDRVWIVANAAKLLGNGRDYNGRGNSESAGSLSQLGNGRSDAVMADADSEPPGRLAIAWGECGHWLIEPDVGRVAHGVPARVDRLRALGNAVVPQIPEIIGRAIMATA